MLQLEAGSPVQLPMCPFCNKVPEKWTCAVRCTIEDPHKRWTFVCSSCAKLTCSDLPERDEFRSALRLWAVASSDRTPVESQKLPFVTNFPTKNSGAKKRSRSRQEESLRYAYLHCNMASISNCEAKIYCELRKTQFEADGPEIFATSDFTLLGTHNHSTAAAASVAGHLRTRRGAKHTKKRVRRNNDSGSAQEDSNNRDNQNIRDNQN